MSSARDRQRAAARAKLEREMAARAEAARRKRLMQARIGAGVAAAVVLTAVVWIITAAVSGGSEPVAAPTSGSCTWKTDPNAFDPSASSLLREGVKDVGLPETDVPRSGFQVLTLETNLGTVKIEMDLSKTPCTAANLAFLAKQKYYDGSTCHRLVPAIFALQCGDPTGTGQGGATYKVQDENLPTGKLPAYHEGDVAMANTGQPDTNGTQFFFVYGNSPLEGKYSLFGHVIEGWDIVKKVAAAGFEGDQQGGEGKPKTTFEVKTVMVSDVLSQASPTTPAASLSTSSASPTASATASP